MEKNLPALLKGNRKNLRAALLLALQALETAKIEYKNLILFGSWLTATAGPESDIDLCVVLESNFSESEHFDKTAIAVSIKRLPFDFDVLIIDEQQFKTDFVSPIIHEIRTKGRVI